MEDIIKLRLRKPKAWNWELTTSKSLPHIALPTIQLYNSKGQLLVETKDYGMKRLSWSNIDHSNNITNQIQRSRSDAKIQHNNNKNSVGKLDRNNNRKLQENNKRNTEEIRLKKSKSEILQKESNQCGKLNSKSRTINGEINIRSRAEILERLRKCSQESLKRAMMDGYQNFLNFHSAPASDNQDKKRTYTRSKSQLGKVLNNEQKLDINHFTHKKYKTRTSSAGTLIIDESFNNGYRRRPNENSVNKPTVYRDITGQQQNKSTGWRDINEHPNMLFQSHSTTNIPDSNCNYIVQEPITPVRDNNNENKKEKRKAKLIRKHSIDSTSSSAAEKRNRLKRKDDTKGRIYTFFFCCEINQ